MAAAADYVKVAQEIYISYFGRPADYEGLQNMTNQLAAAGAPTTTAELDAAYATNSTVRALIDSFGTSTESASLYNGSTTQFVTAIYQNLFNRDPDMAGLNFWSNAIASGNLTRAAAAHSILAGAVTAENADATIIANKVAVATNFTTAIDTIAEINAYGGNAAAALARDMLHGVTGTTVPADYQATVTATLANLVANTSNGSTINLTTGVDTITGTSGNDTFVARIFDNSNSAQSGDVINGGAGIDTLRADIGNSQKFAISLETTSVENIVIRAQTVSTDGTDNNTSVANKVQIDGERMQGVTRWENSNSRADLLIEDVRIQDSQITKDITIAMVSTDPGNVDYGVYFDQHSLRAAPVTNVGAVLRLQLMDTRSADAGTAPLLNNPYNGFQFTFNGQVVRVASEAIDQAQTYAQLLTAIQTAVAATPGIQNFVVSLGGTFNAADTLSGRVQTGSEIVLTNPGAGVITLDTGSGWLAAAAVPPSSGLHTAILTTAPTSIVSLVTSTIVLDDVGRGSNGGDLVVGGLSIGDTSLSRGVDRFEITVERNSKLQTINSTNNALKEVQIVNGATNKGSLSVNGNANGGVVTATDAALPGTNTTNGGSQHGDQYGFHDVRLIDASAMTGDVAFTSVITERAYAKYITTQDTQAGPAVDNIDFVYSGGAGNDTIAVDINGGLAASRSHLLSGLEDFTFTVNGGLGDDALSVRIVTPGVNDTAWLANQDLNDNVKINGGDGDNTIRKLGSGDTRITTGSGNDTIYTENTGFQTINTLNNLGAATTEGSFATWVFNTADQNTAAAIGVRNIADLRSDVPNTYNLIGTKVNVSFQGIASTVTVGTTLANPTATDLEINQAIKAAINNDAVLKKLLVAQDGPSGALVIKSLIDGAMVAGDLTVSLAAPTLASLTAAQVTAGAAAYNLTGGAATAANVLAAINTSVTNFNTKGDYTSALANDTAGIAITGADGVAISDNIVTPGAGNDVIVLGTHVGASAALSSNDTIVFGANFGNDTIVNFESTGFGIDHLDFAALGGNTLTNSFTTNQSINVSANLAANGTPLTLAQIAALYNANNATAQTHVYVAVDNTGNVGTVYQVADAVGAGNAVATLAGTIDLANTAWSTLTTANFVNSSAAGYHLLEGAAGALPVVVVPPVTTAVATLSGTATTFNAASSDFITSVANTATRTANVVNFANGDQLSFANGTTFAFNDVNVTDNLIQVVATNGAVATTLNVTGAPGSNIGAINNAADFNLVFGANALSVEAAPAATAVAGAGTFSAASGAFQFDFAQPANPAASYLTTVTNFSAHDVLSFGAVAGTALSIVNGNATDGIVDVVATFTGGETVTVRLTGLSADIDTALGTTVANFNAQFGAGSLVA